METAGAVAGGLIGLGVTGTWKGAIQGATLGMFTGGVLHAGGNVRRYLRYIKEERNRPRVQAEPRIQRVPRRDLPPGTDGVTSPATGNIKIRDDLDYQGFSLTYDHESVHSAGVPASALLAAVFHQVRTSSLTAFLIEEFAAARYEMGSAQSTLPYMRRFLLNSVKKWKQT
jgi:hypothetical protein